MSPGRNPLVSVIVPNFNYARFLNERIATIKAQTFQQFELIILDDGSTDDSLKVISRQPPDDRMSVVVNDTNSGNVFKQWNLGIQRARGKYVWIAEADDSSDPEFLETLLAKAEAFDETAIVYCQSVIVDEAGRQIESFSKYTGNLSHDKWAHDYINDGLAEIRECLIARNTIPNASACLFRRSVLVDAGMASTDFDLCGDWFTYIRLLEKHSIAFCARPLNRYRRHSATVRALSREGLLFVETYRVLDYIFKKLEVSQASRDFALSYNFEELSYYVEHQARGHSWMYDSGFFDLACSIDPGFALRLEGKPHDPVELRFAVPRGLFLKKQAMYIFAPGEKRQIRLPLKGNSVEIHVLTRLTILISKAYYCEGTDEGEIRSKIDLCRVDMDGAVQKLELGKGLRLWLTQGRSVLRWPIDPVNTNQKAHIEFFCFRDMPASAFSPQ